MRWSTTRQRSTATRRSTCGSGRWLDWLFPRHCALCDGILARAEEGVCTACAARLASLRDPVVLAGEFPVFAAFAYRGAIRAAVLRMKYTGRAEYASCFGAALAKAGAGFLAAHPADVLVPVPMHRDRRRTRWYNQAEEIARVVSRTCGIPARNDLAARIRHTQPQNALTQAARRENVAGAFRAARPLAGLRVMLVEISRRNVIQSQTCAFQGVGGQYASTPP